MNIKLPQQIELTNYSVLWMWLSIHILYGLLNHYHWLWRVRQFLSTPQNYSLQELASMSTTTITSYDVATGLFVQKDTVKNTKYSFDYGYAVGSFLFRIAVGLEVKVVEVIVYFISLIFSLICCAKVPKLWKIDLHYYSSIDDTCSYNCRTPKFIQDTCNY